MATLKDQQLIFDLNEVEAKIAEKTLPLISPQYNYLSLSREVQYFMESRFLKLRL